MTEVVALFNDRTGAERAVEQLYSRGFDASSVGYLDRRRDEAGAVITDPDYIDTDVDDDTAGSAGEEAAKGAAGGAAGGAAVGAGAGLLASAGMLLIPGVGPFLAAGTLAGTLATTVAGAAGGAAIGGAAGAIFGAATDDDTTAGHYRRGVEQGYALLSVQVADTQVNEVVDALRDAGADRVDVYGDEGWVI